MSSEAHHIAEEGQAMEPEAAESLSTRVLPATKRRHDLVWDRTTGDVLSLEQFIQARDYARIVREDRMEAELAHLEGVARLHCPHCGDAMAVRSKAIRNRSEQRFYFDHRNRDARKLCAAGVARLSAQAILAIKFAKKKEGESHKAFKRLVRDSIDADPSFSDTREEVRWWDISGAKWRQPDVQTTRGGERIAIEVQLSTTFVHVIAQRMRFYRQNGGRLLWVFRDLDVDEFKLAEDDIFYSNNRNAFRVTAESQARSIELGQFMLECVWQKPYVNEEGEVSERLERSIVPFSSLTFDVTSAGIPRAFYFDFDTAKSAALEECALKREQGRQARLREAFEALYVPLLRKTPGIDYMECKTRWCALRSGFASVGVRLPEAPDGDRILYDMLVAGYTAKLGDGRAVGTDHRTLYDLGHHFFHQKPHAVWFYCCALVAFDRVGLLKRQDLHKGFLKEKLWKGVLPDYAGGGVIYLPDRRWDKLLLVLFPEIAVAWLRDPVEVARELLCPGGLDALPRDPGFRSLNPAATPPAWE